MTKVIKRNMTTVKFNKEKIENAILKAMEYGSGRIDKKIANLISQDLEKECSTLETISIKDIEKMVFESLCKYQHQDTARAYEGYRAIREYQKKQNTIDANIISLVDLKNEELTTENSNKNAILLSTQRDYMAGEVCKDLYTRKSLPTHLAQAHSEGIIHIHDRDYLFQKMTNCGLVNIKDMLDNGTVINKNMIESPQTFKTACTIMTQIIAQVASSQFGGQSMNIKHLGKYLRRSKMKYEKMYSFLNEKEREMVVEKSLQDELKSGVQTIQYQINTFLTTNGQTPFVTLFLEIDEQDEYCEETARIIHEIFRQRIIGIKNEVGQDITPTFPKLVYVLDHHNCLEGGKYDWVTEEAVKCNAKRFYPDYISAKKMRETYEGNVFSCMGCRSFLSPWKDENDNYKFEGRFNFGVTSLNLPRVALDSQCDMDTFWELLDNRLELCFENSMFRYNYLKGTPSDVAPILWQYGGYARLQKGETIDKLLESGYATVSIGYIGLYEVTKLMIGESHTTEKGQEFALKVMKYMRDKVDTWKKETGLGFGLYGSPSESLCHRFAKLDKAIYGDIKDITDKDYYTNSYHYDVREEVDAFEKLRFESQFQPISSGGCISYVELPNMNHNLDALKTLVNYIYHNVQYGEFNIKSDVCHVCGHDGEMVINDELGWECPNCGNQDQNKMTVVRRTCGYLGANYWNKGKTQEIGLRVMHL